MHVDRLSFPWLACAPVVQMEPPPRHLLLVSSHLLFASKQVEILLLTRVDKSQVNLRDVKQIRESVSAELDAGLQFYEHTAPDCAA